MSRMWASDRRQHRRRTRTIVEGRPTSGQKPHIVASAGLSGAPMASFTSGRVPDGTPTTPKAGARRRANRSPKPPGSNRPSRPWLTKLLFLVNCFGCCLDPHDDDEDVDIENDTAFRGQPAAAQPAPTITNKAGDAPTAPSGAGDVGPTTISRGGDEARPQHDCLPDELLLPTQEHSFGDEGVRGREASDAREAVEEADLTPYSPPTSPQPSKMAADEGDLKENPVSEEPSPITSQELALSDASPSNENFDSPLLEVAFPSAESLSAPPSSPATDLKSICAGDTDEDDVDCSTSGSSLVSDGPVVFSDMSDDEEEESLVEQPEGRPFDELMSLLSGRQQSALTQVVTKWKAEKKTRRLSYHQIFVERAVTLEDFSRSKDKYNNIAAEHRLLDNKASTMGLAGPFPQHLKRLGDGGVGVLYVVGEAQGYEGDRALKRVACFPPRQCYTPAALAKECLHEAEVSEKLIEIRRKEQLEHVVLVHRYTLVTGGLFLEMELLRGGDISKVRNTVTNQDSVIVYIAATVGYVIYVLAAYGIMHHDLSERNLMFNRRGQTKLIDLGHWGPAQACMQWGGTKDFQAPEVQSRQEHNFLADIYSLSYLLFLICRNFTQLSEDVKEMMHALNHEDPNQRPANLAAFQALACFAGIEWSQIADGSFPVPQFLADHAARMASEAQED